jgi:prepilin-type N-terminal cleavage/methylation domain-containing protein
MCKNKHFLNSLGFSLVEIMVAISLIGVLAVAVLNQSKLAVDAKRSSNQQVVISRLTNVLGVELSKQETCSLAANFKGKNVTRTFAAGESIYAANGTTALVTVGGKYGRKDASGNQNAASDVEAVQVTGISTSPSASDTNQMILEIRFSKQTTGFTIFGRPLVITIPLTIIRNSVSTNLIEYCYNDITNSIASAIRLSCQGNTSYYDPTINQPYGACVHAVDSVACPANQFIRRIEYDANAGQNTIKKYCAGLNVTCPTGQVLTGFNADGTVNCAYPFPSCAPGQLMIKSSSGQYICLNSNSGCTGLNAVKSFNADGTVSCARFYPPNSCGGLVRAISPDGITCASNYKTVTCPNGQWVKSFDSTGQGICGKFYEYPQSCAGGYGATGIDSNGNLTCQPLRRTLMCNGTRSNRTYTDCTNAGGVVYNYGTMNAYCHFNADGCGAFTACLDYRRRGAASCWDTHSLCPTAVTYQSLPAQGFSTPVYKDAVRCRHWKSSGKFGCTFTELPAVWTPIYEVGCY